MRGTCVVLRLDARRFFFRGGELLRGFGSVFLGLFLGLLCLGGNLAGLRLERRDEQLRRLLRLLRVVERGLGGGLRGRGFLGFQRGSGQRFPGFGDLRGHRFLLLLCLGQRLVRGVERGLTVGRFLRARGDLGHGGVVFVGVLVQAFERLAFAMLGRDGEHRRLVTFGRSAVNVASTSAAAFFFFSLSATDGLRFFHGFRRHFPGAPRGVERRLLRGDHGRAFLDRLLRVGEIRLGLRNRRERLFRRGHQLLVLRLKLGDRLFRIVHAHERLRPLPALHAGGRELDARFEGIAYSAFRARLRLPAANRRRPVSQPRTPSAPSRFRLASR